LTDPESIKRGFGPVCWAKVQAEMETEEAKQDWRGNEYCGPYDGGDIILERRNGTAFINVPHAIVRHSPTGFEWGYGGSGPADAALNILYAVTQDKEVADRYYQEFKWDFISIAPEQGAIIPRRAILRWLKRKQKEAEMHEHAC